ESFDDTISNGLALCPNLHRAFDRGLISIDDRYQVMVSTKFIEVPSSFSLKQFTGKTIIGPLDAHHQPSLKNLRWHRENTFLK
ncbi:MAG: HNH endonuclease, partial [Candidatus Brocadiae bacterium]|nr:HNH endonuclease [Candidatus Brocadiia bacterium]